MNGPHSFLRGGVHMDDRKEATSGLSIEEFIPTEVTIPLIQHIGAAARATVKRKAVVQRGDLIGEAADGGVPVHASVSGVVERVALQPHPTLVESPAVVITTDPHAAPPPVREDVPGWFTNSTTSWLQAIAAAGIVGLGGAAFPTHRKLSLPSGMSIDTLIINGAECEPYLTSDHRLMVERAQEVVWGAVLIARIIGASEIVIGIEDNKCDAAMALQEITINNGKFFPHPVVRLCHTRYPQGSERQLVEALKGRVVPSGKLPMHVGVIVQNVATAVACYQAIRYRQPLVDRVVTVAGRGIMQPRNLRVPIGTLVRDIVAACGGMHPRAAMVIAGGPMMGRALGRLDVPVIKGTGGLLFLRTDEIRRPVYGPCISCARCVDVCPLGLEPNQISIYTEAGRALETETYGTRECFECGCCAYVCPAERPLVQFIQMAKSAFRTGSAIGLAVRP